LQYADRIITIDDGRIAGSDRPKISGNAVQVAAH
jgi:putative ABC transport system ATP-binding protein